MNIEQKLYAAAVEQAKNRYSAGWEGAAAIRTESGKIITSVAPEIKNRTLALCMEVGAFLEAHRLNEAVTHSICVARDDGAKSFKVLTPCGVCQERLAHWGGDVLAAVTNPENKILFKTIRELQPFHWSAAYGEKL